MRRRGVLGAIGILLAGGSQEAPEVTVRGELTNQLIGFDHEVREHGGYVRAEARITPPERGRRRVKVTARFIDWDETEMRRMTKPIAISEEDSEGVLEFQWLGLPDEVDSVHRVEFSWE